MSDQELATLQSQMLEMAALLATASDVMTRMDKETKRLNLRCDDLEKRYLELHAQLLSLQD